MGWISRFNILWILVMLSFCFSTAGGTTPSEGLMAYYPFDGDYRDYSGNNNHGTAKGSMAFVAGKMDKAASFDGKSWVEAADSSSLDLKDAFTFSLWLYKEDAGTGGWSVLLSKGDTSALDSRSPYALAHTRDGLYPSVRLIRNNYYNTIDSSIKLDFKKWYHLSVTWDGSKIKFYLDGELLDTKNWDAPIPNSDAKLLIGNDPPGATEYFKGTMDDLRIYNYALSENEIKKIMGAESIEPSQTIVPSSPSTEDPSQITSPEANLTTPSKAALLIFESRSKAKGTTVQIPIIMRGSGEKIGNIDMALTYNPLVLEAQEAIKGSLSSGSLFDFNIMAPGKIKVSLADKNGFMGDGSVAQVVFKVVGPPGSSTSLDIIDVSANRAEDFATLEIIPISGSFRVTGLEEGKGDCNGDGRLSSVDALCALRMAVGKQDEDLSMDVSNDGKVTSLDARQILRTTVTINYGDAQSQDGSDSEDISLDEIETSDINGDGSPDRFILSLEREEILPGVFLEKTIGIENGGMDNSAEISLKFENTNGETVQVNHIEDFSKSFAGNVNQIQFSRQPDRIIDEDPIVEWFLSLPGNAIEVVTSRVPGFSHYPMDVDSFAEMPEAEKCKWIENNIGKHKQTIQNAADRYGVPAWLVSAVLLNELADYNYKDQFQEIIPNRGSVGMAQMNVKTAQKYGLVSVSEKEIQDHLATIYTPSIDMGVTDQEQFRQQAIDHVVWRKLNQPEIAIDAAAHRISIIIDEANKNLDKTWPQALLTGPIDKNDPLKNVKMQVPNARKPEDILNYKKEGLALFTIAAYNTDTILSSNPKVSNFNLPSPYNKRDRAKPEEKAFANAINHGNNGVDLFVQRLVKCDEKKEDPDEVSEEIPEECMTAVSHEEKRDCMFEVSKKSSFSLDTCNKITKDSDLKDWCIYWYVYKDARNRVHLCDTIKHSEIKKYCTGLAPEEWSDEFKEKMEGLKEYGNALRQGMY